MVKLLKVKNISKDPENEGERTIVKFENNKEIKKMEEDFKIDMKTDDYVFCNIEQGDVEELPWRLYKDNNGKDVYELWEENETNSCHYGLKIDKLTNIFNGREEIKQGKVDNSIHKNIDEFLKENRNLYEDMDFEVKVLDRLIVGLGGHSAFETDIKLHHTYGVPYIPASAVKGCLKSHIIQKYEDKNIEEESWFKNIFGGVIDGKMYQGNVIFMDVFPKDTFKIKKDIMTPHYQHGYTDDGIITPIELLTVEDTFFRFVLRINIIKFLNDDGLEIKIEGKDVKDFIIEALIETITTHGIGAKTSVGYGYFQEITKEKCLFQSEENDKRIKEEIEKDKREYLDKIEKEKEQEKLKNMTESQKKLYLVVKIKDSKKRKEKLKKLFANREREKLDQEEIIRLAKLIRRDLENADKWKYTLGKKGKENKSVKRIKKICEILNIQLPQNN